MTTNFISPQDPTVPLDINPEVDNPGGQLRREVYVQPLFQLKTDGGTNGVCFCEGRPSTCDGEYWRYRPNLDMDKVIKKWLRTGFVDWTLTL